jgi:hypothetical protein
LALRVLRRFMSGPWVVAAEAHFAEAVQAR